VDLSLKNKVFIISGSSRGIGKGIATTLAEEGANIVLTGRTEKELITTSKELEEIFPNQVLSHKGDLQDKKTLRELEHKVISKWGKIDGIVANAANIKKIPDINIKEKDWLWFLENNFHVAVGFVDTFTDHLIANKGSIVIIGSIAGLEDLSAPMPYSISKAAVNVYSRSLAKRLGEYGVRVNCVAPGNIIFKGGNWDKKLNADPKTVKKMIKEKVALKMFGDPTDIGNITTFLLSDKAKFITGSTFVVDGGQTVSF